MDDSYEKEPEPIFLPLDHKRYCEFYNLEMANFEADLPFYQSHLQSDHSVLELGAGSGRLTRRLAHLSKSIVALDISQEMLLYQKNSPKLSCICGNMCDFALNTSFDRIVIPYNSLNLLKKNDVNQCLACCSTHMHEKSLLLLQLHIPRKEHLDSQEKTFQFQVFSLPSGGKIIKETLRSYSSKNSTLTLEERYRVRPFKEGYPNEDLLNTTQLYTPSQVIWQQHFDLAGLHLSTILGGYTLEPYQESRHTTLFMVLGKNS